MHTACFLATYFFFHHLQSLWDALFVKTDSMIQVLDIGAQDINGNNYDAIALGKFNEKYVNYHGLDLSNGFNVDLVMDIQDLQVENYFDIIISSNCLEHDDFFWETFIKMSKILKVHGFLYVSVPSTAAIHRYPVDNWRMFPDAAHALSKYGKKFGLFMHVVHAEIVPGYGDLNIVFWKSDGWNPPKLSLVKDSFKKYAMNVIVNTIQLYELNNETIPPLLSDLYNTKLFSNYNTVSTRMLWSRENAWKDVIESIPQYTVDIDIIPIDQLSNWQYYTSPVYCRRSIGYKHPIHHLQFPHVIVLIQGLNYDCIFDLQLVLLESDLYNTTHLMNTLVYIHTLFDSYDISRIYNFIMDNIYEIRNLPVISGYSTEQLDIIRQGYNIYRNDTKWLKKL